MLRLFRFQWLRKFVRRHTTPIPEDRAAQWKSRLSVIYMLIAWNAFGLVGYMIYSGKSDWAKYYGAKSDAEMKMSPGHQWAKMLGLQNSRVYRLTGLKLVEIPEAEEIDSDKVQTQ